MGLRVAGFLLWALVAASAVVWGLRLGGRGTSAPAATPLLPAEAPLRGDIRRVLGTATAAVSAASPATAVASAPPAAQRFRLVGLVAPQPHRATAADMAPAVALIAVDGGPPRAFRVGARVDDRLWVLQVRSTGVRLGPPPGAPAANATETLELPAPERPLPAAPGASARPSRPSPALALPGPTTAVPNPAPVATSGAPSSAPTSAEGEPVASAAAAEPGAPPRRRPGPAGAATR